MTLASLHHFNFLSLSVCLIPTGDVCSDCFYGCYCYPLSWCHISREKLFWLLSMLKSVVLPNIFMEMVIHFQDSLVNRKFKRKAFIWNRKRRAAVWANASSFLSSKTHYSALVYLDDVHLILCDCFWSQQIDLSSVHNENMYKITY